MPCEPEQPAVEAKVQAAQALNLPEGVPPLRSLYVYASGDCNLACRHCWIVPTYRPRRDGGRYVELEHVGKAIREGKPLGLQSVKLTGGEPILHPRFRDLVTLIAEQELGIVVETNGTLVDDDLAAFLKGTPQVSFISISLDGADAETHDTLRAVSGSHQQAIEGIKALVKVGFRPQIICTLHRDNAGQVDEILSLAEALGCGSVKFNTIQEMGRGEQFAAEQGLAIAETLDLYRHVERETSARNGMRIHFDIPLAFFSLPKLLHDRLSRCGILNILGLLSSGELSLCGIGTTVPDLVYGHVARDDLGAVWCDSPGLIQLRELVPAHLTGICGECLHRDLCLGSCVANNYQASGWLNAPYQFCTRADALGLFPASRKRQPGG